MAQREKYSLDWKGHSMLRGGVRVNDGSSKSTSAHPREIARSLPPQQNALWPVIDVTTLIVS